MARGWLWRPESGRRGGRSRRSFLGRDSGMHAWMAVAVAVAVRTDRATEEGVQAGSSVAPRRHVLH